MRRSEIRDHLLETALRLFNLHGYHATGIDLIVAEAGIAKTTLYRHFETKEDLILAALQARDEQSRAEMRKYVDARTQEPSERLLATFDFLEEAVRDDRFRGCIFLSAAGEHKEAVDPVFQAAVMHKRLVLAYFEELAHAARFVEARRIADTINLLHEGAMAVAQVTRSGEPVRQGKHMAAILLAGEPRKTPDRSDGPQPFVSGAGRV